MVRLIGVIILVGVVSLIAGLVQKIFYLDEIMRLIPSSFLKFADTCLLVAMALSLRQLAKAK